MNKHKKQSDNSKSKAIISDDFKHVNKKPKLVKTSKDGLVVNTIVKPKGFNTWGTHKKLIITVASVAVLSTVGSCIYILVSSNNNYKDTTAANSVDNAKARLAELKKNGISNNANAEQKQVYYDDVIMQIAIIGDNKQAAQEYITNIQGKDVNLNTEQLGYIADSLIKSGNNGAAKIILLKLLKQSQDYYNEATPQDKPMVQAYIADIQAKLAKL